MESKKRVSEWVVLAYDCNDNCVSCPVPVSNKQNPDFESIKKEINDVADYYDRIGFNGGEPTLRKDLLKILQYANKKGFKDINLLTNVQMFYYEEYAKQISKIKNLEISTTFYGPNSLVHDAITRTPGSFEHKMKGAKNLLKYKVPLRIRIVLHKMNYRYFRDICKFIADNFTSEEIRDVSIMNAKITNEARKNKNIVVEKTYKIAEQLLEPFRLLQQRGFQAKLYHFPHCVLPEELWPYSAGITTTLTELKFPDFCEECKKRNDCTGIWVCYYGLESNEGFKPIK